jgi:hypothetical protein
MSDLLQQKAVMPCFVYRAETKKGRKKTAPHRFGSPVRSFVLLRLSEEIRRAIVIIGPPIF